MVPIGMLVGFSEFYSDANLQFAKPHGFDILPVSTFAVLTFAISTALLLFG